MEFIVKTKAVTKESARFDVGVGGRGRMVKFDLLHLPPGP